jgi:ABC-type sugar transport system ATPase subunit/ribose/xylose/arabinose/galactoside ABC-type transport system permease subunit
MRSDAILRVERVSKSFYGVKALKDVSFDVFPGEVVGLVGANGAGKSTLLKVIGGIFRSEEGKVFLENEALEGINPHIAQQKGIISVYQELNLFSHMSVAENLLIGKEHRTWAGTINWQSQRRQAAELLAEMDLAIDPDAVVSSLSVAQQHLVEIARALQAAPKLLLLDEPTASLSETEIQWLFARVKDLVSKGTTVLYVSHRLDEVAVLCKRCVILRDGSLAKELDGEFDVATIVRYMIGHEVTLGAASEKLLEGEAVFECRNLSTDKVKDVSFGVRKGEILGIAGLVGAGRTELLRAIFGVDAAAAGSIMINGREHRARSPRGMIASGLVLVPEDRKLEGLFLSENVRFNIAASTMDTRVRAGLIDGAAEKRAVRKAAEDVLLDTGRLEHQVKLLSGGNQQKAILAKALLVDADLLLLDEPTRGVDVGAREEIYQVIRGLAEKGKSIILVSSDWEELIALCARILVMAEGKVTGELSGPEISQERIMDLSSVTHVSREGEQSRLGGAAWRWLRRLFGGALGSGRTDGGKSAAARLGTRYLNSNTTILALILLGFIILGLIISPSFRTWANTRNLMGQAMPFLLLTLGQLVVIIAGGLDLSVGALVASTTVLGMTIMLQNPANVLLGALAMVGLALLVGTINGLLVVKANIDSFVATLGMSIVMEGLALVITPKPLAPSPRILRTIAYTDVLGVPYALFIIVVVVAVFALLLKYTALGRRFFAVGDNPTGSFWAGLPVVSTKFASFIICSFMAVLTSLFMLGRTGAGDPVFGPGLELDAIACALIGGASLAGGSGSLAGAVCGVLVLTILSNVLSLMEVNQWYQEVVRGVILLSIIISYERRVRRKARA